MFRELMLHAANLTAMPNGKNIENVAASYFAELGQYTLETVTAAVRRHCRSEKFFPALADVVKGIEGDMTERAAMAWAELDAAALKFGGDRSVRFSDPATHYAVQKMRGWESLGWRVKDGDTWLKKDFETYFLAGVKRGVTWADVPPVLEGTFTGRIYDAALQTSFPAYELPAPAGQAQPALEPTA